MTRATAGCVSGYSAWHAASPCQQPGPRSAPGLAGGERNASPGVPRGASTRRQGRGAGRSDPVPPQRRLPADPRPHHRGALALLPPGAECFRGPTSQSCRALPARTWRRATRAPLTGRLPRRVGHSPGGPAQGRNLSARAAGKPEGLTGNPCAGRAPALTKRPGVTVTVDALHSGPWSCLRGEHGRPLPTSSPDEFSPEADDALRTHRSAGHRARCASAPARTASSRAAPGLSRPGDRFGS